MWTASTHFSSIDSVQILLSKVDNYDIVQGGVPFSQQRSAKHSEHREIEFLWEKYKKQLGSSFQKTKSMQTSGSVVADGDGHVEKTKVE